MIGRDTENETGHAVLREGKKFGGKKKREEIRGTKEDIENERYRGIFAR